MKNARFSNFGFGTACIALLLGAAPAFADITTYQSYADWASVVSGLTTVTIPEPEGSLLDLGSGDASVTYSGVTFSQIGALNSNIVLLVLGSSFSGVPGLSSEGGGLENLDILITMPTPVKSLALNYGTYLNTPVTFLLSNGDSIVEQTTGSGFQTLDLFAITDNTPFSSVLLTNPSELALNANSIAYGDAVAATPEPRLFGVIALAMGGLFWMARRRRQRD